MDYLLMVLVGLVGGGACTFVAMDTKRRRLDVQKREQTAEVERLGEVSAQLRSKEQSLLQKASQLELNIRAREEKSSEILRVRRKQLEQQLAQIQATLEDRRKSAQQEIADKEQQFAEQLKRFRAAELDFNSKRISYNELHDENSILKRDLANLHTNLRKSALDQDVLVERQALLDQKVQQIGSRYLAENVKWIGKSLNANNFVQCKQRLVDVIERCRGIGFEVTEEQEAVYVADLRAEFEKAVRAAFEREEQARIRTQIREEQKLEREIQREQARLERERTVLKEALARALATAADVHSAEIESLKARLAEAEAKERAISQAQLTKAGFVYVISNIGSFGAGVFKIGMTRRLEPLERVRELGDASVPFPFDIHMMISCENAPSLENALHRELLKQQINKMNPRKEFFRADIETIARIVRDHHGQVEYVADAEALQFRQSLEASDEDIEFIEHVFEELEEEDESFGEDISQPVMPSD